MRAQAVMWTPRGHGGRLHGWVIAVGPFGAVGGHRWRLKPVAEKSRQMEARFPGGIGHGDEQRKAPLPLHIGDTLDGAIENTLGQEPKTEAPETADKKDEDHGFQDSLHITLRQRGRLQDADVSDLAVTQVK